MRCYSALWSAAVFLAATTALGEPPVLEWTVTAGGRWDGTERVEDLVVHDATGTVVVGGNSYRPQTIEGVANLDYLAAAFETDGEPLWSLSSGEDQQDARVLAGMAMDQETGTVLLNGQSWPSEPSPGGYAAELFALGVDLEGTHQYASFYGLASRPQRTRWATEHNPASGAFLSAYSEYGVLGVNWWPDGSHSVLASPGSYGALSSDVATSAATGNSYISGAEARNRTFVASYDVDGNLRWYRVRVGQEYSLVLAGEIAHDSLRALSYQGMRTNAGYAIAGFDDEGEELWFHLLPHTYREAYRPLAVDVLHGRVAYAGYDADELGVQRLQLLVFDGATGETVWSLQDGPEGYYEALTFDAAGNVYLLAEVQRRPAVLSYDPSGAERFVMFLEAPDLYLGAATELHVDGRLNVYVGAEGCFAPCAGGDDLVVFKYSQLPTIEAIARDVQALVASGVLSRGEGRALLSMLDAAAASLERGNLDSVSGQLTAFSQAVAGFVLSGRLAEETGEALSTAVQGVLDAL